MKRRDENIYNIIAHADVGSRFILKYSFGSEDLVIEIGSRGQKKVLKTASGHGQRGRIISGQASVRSMLGHPYAILSGEEIIYNAAPIF